MVTVHARMSVERNSIVFTSHGTRLERSYSEKSMVEFMAWVYRLLAVVSSKMSFSWMVSWNMGWLSGD